MNRDLILTTAFSYSIEQIEPFLFSLNNHYTGTLVVFGDSKIPKVKGLSFQLVSLAVHVNDISNGIGFRINNSNNWRYLAYKKYLDQNPEWDRVVISDIRDVVFQANPFENHVSKNLLIAAQENNIIAKCPYNSLWLNALYGEEYLESHQHNAILCSGTTIAPIAIMRKYLNDMSNDIVLHSARLDSGQNSMIIDQGVHFNWCQENPEMIAINTNANGSIFTMGYAESFLFNRNGMLVNQLFQPYSILHQFDRFPFITEMVSIRVSALKKAKHKINWKLFR